MDKRSIPKFHPSFYGPRYWPTWLGIGFFYLLSVLPMTISLGIGRLIGDLFYYVARSRRHIAKVNIAKCFPDLSALEQHKLVRDVMRSTGKAVVEAAVGLWGPAYQLKDRYSISGLEHIEAAKASGQGVLLVGFHFTTIDLVGRVLCAHLEFDVLYRKDPNPLMAYVIAKARGKFAQNAIVRADTRQLIKNLRDGHVVWYAPDQDYGAKYSVFAPFFGVQAATIIGTSRIAKMGKASVIPIVHYRGEGNHYHIEISPPLENYPTGDDVADATRINQLFEIPIAKHPDQYLWVHRRFKTRPEGEPDFYTRKKS